MENDNQFDEDTGLNGSWLQQVREALQADEKATAWWQTERLQNILEELQKAPKPRYPVKVAIDHIDSDMEPFLDWLFNHVEAGSNGKMEQFGVSVWLSVLQRYKLPAYEDFPTNHDSIAYCFQEFEIAPFDESLKPYHKQAITFKVKKAGRFLKLEIGYNQRATIVTISYVAVIDRLFEDFPDAKIVGATKQVESQEKQETVNVVKHEPLYCNKWLFKRYFDESQTDLSSLVTEWLKIRSSKDFKPNPINPRASMKTAISEERKRRRLGIIRNYQES